MMSMQLQINGKQNTVESVRTIIDLLAHLNIQQPRVAVMVNEAVVRRADHSTFELHDGDNVEIITMVGGG